MAKGTSKEEKPISFERIRRITEDTSSTVHFVGVGGISMYSLARLAALAGARVTGSDREEGPRTKKLVECGIDVHIGHSADNVHGASLVVYTHAISADNPELTEAALLEIPIVSRAEFMGAVMVGYGSRIGVSGSHGKSTTVAMLDAIFSHAKTEPTVLSGAELYGGEPLKVGERGLMIYESCEYKDSFLKFAPTVSLGLNLELDHTDYFESLVAMKESFRKALGKATAFSVINGDDENLKTLIKTLRSRVVTFGQSDKNDYTYYVTAFKDSGFEFSISRFGNKLGDFEIRLPGVFNVTNAVAAIVCALEYGIDKDIAAEAIRDFSGVPRRLEHIGVRFGRDIYYDYAHHPTEIAASINALKVISPDHLVTVIFKPHTFTRTASLWEEFISALSLADHVIMTDIYPAREEAIDGVSSLRLASCIGPQAVFRYDDDTLAHLDLNTHGVIVIMGAGDMDVIKDDVLNHYF